MSNDNMNPDHMSLYNMSPDNTSHDTGIAPTLNAIGVHAVVDTAGLAAASSPDWSSVEQQRRALKAQVEALRQVGALPSAGAGRPASAVQWNNWSNG